MAAALDCCCRQKWPSASLRLVAVVSESDALRAFARDLLGSRASNSCGDQPAMRTAQSPRSASMCRLACCAMSFAVMSPNTTTGNFNPLTLWIVISRTPSARSSKMASSTDCTTATNDGLPERARIKPYPYWRSDFLVRRVKSARAQVRITANLYLLVLGGIVLPGLAQESSALACAGFCRRIQRKARS
jgi:hypothetical protein